QAEDGIRDATVTGVQTCALPIWLMWAEALSEKSAVMLPCSGARSEAALRVGSEPRPGLGMPPTAAPSMRVASGMMVCSSVTTRRSEERRVGKVCRCEGEEKVSV